MQTGLKNTAKIRSVGPTLLATISYMLLGLILERFGVTE